MMKNLSKKTVTTIVNALITARLVDAKAHQEAGEIGHTNYQSTIQLQLDENAEALRELNLDAAPWLQFHPQLRDVFPGTANTLLLAREAS